MKSLKSERGQALLLIALGAVVLFGFAALAIDSSRVYEDKRHAQNAADTSALAAAVAIIRQQNYTTAALARAAANGYDNNGTSNTVMVNMCDELNIQCDGVPASASKSEYVRVRITSIVPMTLGRVVGWQFMTNDVQAIARVKGMTDEPNPLFGAGLVSVRSDPSDDCFKINGGADLTLHNTGIFVNCTGSRALMLNGSANVGMDANAQVAGCSNDTSFDVSPGVVECNVASQPIDQSTFANYPRTLPTPICSTPGSQVGNVMNPGYFNSGVVINSATTFNLGTYCFNASLYLGNRTVNIGGTGAVQWVLAESAVLSGTADFENLEIYATNTSFQVQNTGNLTADRFRFFGNGNSSLGVQGGTLTSGDAYIFSQTGEIDIDAQSEVNLHAPPPEDDFGGILMHMPWENTNNFELNGGTNDVWTGLILMPHSHVTYNGGSEFELHGQVIGYEFTINGDGTSDIYFESTGVAAQPEDPTIEFTR
jgi:Flp pilus assembly protein TadG